MRLYWLSYDAQPGIVSGTFRMASDYDEAEAIGHWLFGDSLRGVYVA